MNPFTFGGVFNRFFSILGKNAGLIAVVGLVGYVLPNLLVSLAAQHYGIIVAENIPSEGALWGVPDWVFVFGIALLNLAFYMVNLSMITEIAILRAVGKKPELGAIFARGLVNIVPILIVSILMGLWVLAGLVALIVPGIMRLSSQARNAP